MHHCWRFVKFARRMAVTGWHRGYNWGSGDQPISCWANPVVESSHKDAIFFSIHKVQMPLVPLLIPLLPLIWTQFCIILLIALHFSWKLSLLWIGGFLFRYLILVPIRIVLFTIGMVTMCGVCYLVGHIPNIKLVFEILFRRIYVMLVKSLSIVRVKKFLNRHVMLMSMRIFSRSFSSIIRFHDRYNIITLSFSLPFLYDCSRENRAKKGGICVANHTSPIDVMVLSCDNCYAMIGQKQGGILGLFEFLLLRGNRLETLFAGNKTIHLFTWHWFRFHPKCSKSCRTPHLVREKWGCWQEKSYSKVFLNGLLVASRWVFQLDEHVSHKN